MRGTVAGFFFGVMVTLVGLLVVQQIGVAPVVDAVGYHFQACVFGGPDFPAGDLDNGRLLRRGLVPSFVTTRFFDAGFHEVTRADRPGRYGAVVKMRFTGRLDTYRFITLYRTPVLARGDLVRIPITAQFPAEFGIDPAVVAAQQPAIGAALQNMLLDYEDGSAPESFAILLAGLSETAPTDRPEFMYADANARNDAWWQTLRTRLKLQTHYKDIVDLPDGYAADPARRWPLILFLHHSDAGGSDLNVVRHCALMDLLARGRRLPAVVVAPQCPTFQSWSVPVLNDLLDQIARDYRIDPDRVYLTGVSAGGDTTWDLAKMHPDRFAALVPMSGESDERNADLLRNIPVWGFQGAKDPIVPLSEMQKMVDAVRRAGGHAHLTVFPDAGHDCWTAAYSTDALWTWLFAQKRGQPEVVTPGTPSP